jgi:hypothetical protein
VLGFEHIFWESRSAGRVSFFLFFVTSISREHTIIVINRYHSPIRDFRGISPHGLDVERVSGREEP